MLPARTGAAVGFRDGVRSEPVQVPGGERVDASEAEPAEGVPRPEVTDRSPDQEFRRHALVEGDSGDMVEDGPGERHTVVGDRDLSPPARAVVNTTMKPRPSASTIAVVE
jgi:hypothetical protein